MAQGTKHDLTGLLLIDGLYPVLRVPGGGEWRLDINRRYRHLLGKRVRILGIRDGFDLLAVERIEAA